MKPVPPAGPTLRNKPGGMAWINGVIDSGDGARVLVNRVVVTKRLINGDMWEIDPPQRYVATTFTRFSNGVLVHAGDTVTAIGMRDMCLTPIREVGDGERDESLAWLPPVPTKSLTNADLDSILRETLEHYLREHG